MDLDAVMAYFLLCLDLAVHYEEKQIKE